MPRKKKPAVIMDFFEANDRDTMILPPVGKYEPRTLIDL
jgi:hypothetical protein